MRALAEFIMRGRPQAAAVAILGNWVPLLTPATVGLISLRAGANNGLLILLWGLLPALLPIGASQVGPAIAAAIISSGLLAFAVALLLRRGARWSHCLMASVGLATLMALLQTVLVPDSLRAVLEGLRALMVELAGSEGVTPDVGLPFVVGLIAYFIGFHAVLGLMLGRWWQALVFNPGGFGAEFQALKLHPVQAVTCMAATVYCLLQGVDYALWAGLFALPLMFQGIAIVHRLAAIRGWGVQWLVLFYAALVLMDPVSQLLAVFAFLDTWLNFRERAMTPKG